MHVIDAVTLLFFYPSGGKTFHFLPLYFLTLIPILVLNTTPRLILIHRVILVVIVIIVRILSFRHLDLFQVKVLIRARVAVTDQVQLQAPFTLRQAELELCIQFGLDSNLLDSMELLRLSVTHDKPP